MARPDRILAALDRIGIRSKGFAFHFVASPCLEFPARFRWIATSQKSLDTARVADIRSTVLDSSPFPLVTPIHNVYIYISNVLRKV